MKKSILIFFLFLFFVPSSSPAKDLYEEKLDRGIRNSEPYAYLLVKESGTKKDRAVVLREALKYAPDLPATYFELAKNSFNFTPEGLFEAIDYMLRGVAAYKRNFWWSFMMGSSLLISLILSFLFSILTLILIRLPGDLPLFTHDIKESKNKIFLLAVLIPSVFGPLYLLGGLLFILSFYQKKLDKLVLGLYILFLLVSPWIFRTVSIIFNAPASGELRAVVQVNEAKDNGYAITVLAGSGNPVEVFSYALALKREGKYHEAIDVYSRLIASRPSPRSYNNLANCYVAINNIETAKDLYKKSLEGGRLPATLYNLSQVYRETLDFERGDEYFLAAQSLDREAVSQFRTTFGRNPNRFVIDERLPVSDIFAYSEGKATNAYTMGLSTIPPPFIPVTGILMVILFPVLSRRIKTWAYRCSKCEKILCTKCEKHIVWGRMCLQCYRSLVKLDELDAKERIARLLTVYEHQKRRRDIIKIISHILPGAGLIYAGNILYGFFFLWIFLFSIFVLITNSFFVVEMSNFSHLWLDLVAVFLMVAAYLSSNSVTKRRIARGWL